MLLMNEKLKAFFMIKKIYQNIITWTKVKRIKLPGTSQTMTENYHWPPKQKKTLKIITQREIRKEQ